MSELEEEQAATPALVRSTLLALGHALRPNCPTSLLHAAAEAAVSRGWHAVAMRLLPELAESLAEEEVARAAANPSAEAASRAPVAAPPASGGSTRRVPRRSHTTGRIDAAGLVFSALLSGQPAMLHAARLPSVPHRPPCPAGGCMLGLGTWAASLTAVAQLGARSCRGSVDHSLAPRRRLRRGEAPQRSSTGGLGSVGFTFRSTLSLQSSWGIKLTIRVARS